MTDRRRKKSAEEHTCVIFPASILAAMRKAKQRQIRPTLLDDEPETCTERRPTPTAELSDA